MQSGEQAVKWLEDRHADLVILDMSMPGGIDGAETLRRIRQSNPEQRAIMLSGFAPPDRISAARELGICAYVRKPVTLSVLAAAVQSALEPDPEPAGSSPRQ